MTVTHALLNQPFDEDNHNIVLDILPPTPIQVPMQGNTNTSAFRLRSYTPQAYGKRLSRMLYGEYIS